MMVADAVAALWTAQRKFCNDRILRTRRFFEEALDLDDEELSATDAGSVAELPRKEREAERGNTPRTPLRRKGKGKKLRSHCV